jgi:hypothetical protein
MKQFIYTPEKYPGPIAMDVILSKEAKDYLMSLVVQINMSTELLDKIVSENPDT